MTNPNQSLKNAINRGDAKGVQNAISAGADITSNPYELVVLAMNDYIYGSEHGRFPEVLYALHESGVNMNAADPETGMSGLHYLMRNLDDSRTDTAQLAPDVREMLLKIGMDWNVVDKAGNRPFHPIKRSSFYLDPLPTPSDIKWLVENGVDVNAPNGEGKTLAHMIISAYDTPELSAAGLNLNVVDHDGNTPWHDYADRAYSGDDDTVRSLALETGQELKRCGVDLRAKNKAGKDASALSVASCGEDIMDVFVPTNQVGAGNGAEERIKQAPINSKLY